MTRTVSRHVAEAFARERGQLFGQSVFPAENFPTETPWYVGTAEELDKIGVIAPEEPSHD